MNIPLPLLAIMQHLAILAFLIKQITGYFAHLAVSIQKVTGRFGISMDSDVTL